MFIPHTDSEREEMLKEIGISSLDELFTAVPKDFRFPKLNLPPALTEMEVLAELTALASVNESTHELMCFLGAGAYNHYIPAAVDAIIRRGEFMT
ncbi:glycine dehydrogenase, partial [bacterium]|nr:glycine dehydrogenase [bacterium]